MITTCRPIEMMEEARPRFSFIGSMTANRLGRQYKRRKLPGVKEVIDVAGNRLPRRLINDLGKQLGLSWLIALVQLRR